MARPTTGTRLSFLLKFLLVVAVANTGIVLAQDQQPDVVSSTLSASASASPSAPESSVAVTSVVSESASASAVEPSSIEPSSAAPEPSVTDAPEASEAPLAPSTSVRIVTRTTIPIEPVTFTPYPIPEERPIPGAFPGVQPKNPPPVGSRAIPNFGAAWDKAYKQAKGRISRYTLAEKVNVTTGVGWEGGRCVGNIPPIPFTKNPNPITSDTQFPGLCLEDAPTGVRFADYVSVFPNGINAAASWNRRLIRERGLLMGREFKGKGVNVALGPMMNMGRVPQGGRNWEGFGADPFLAGEAAYETVLGLQAGGTQACAKHLVENEQEYKRTMSEWLRLNG